MNGFGHLYAQIVITIILSVVYPITAVLVGKFLGINGILLAFVLVTIVNFVWSRLQYTKIVNGTANGFWIK